MSKHRNTIARDLRTPKYRARVVADKRKKANKRACRQALTPVSNADRYFPAISWRE